MYEGKLIRLVAQKPENAEFFVRWMNVAETVRQMGTGPHMPMTLEQETRWITENGGRKPNENHFAVETLNGQLIGSCSYHKYDAQRRTCEVGWFIGDPAMRNKGYGTDIIRTLVNLCFQEMDLVKVKLAAFEYNTRALRLYERLGFVREGTLREEVYAMGRRWDECLYGMLRREWEQNPFYHE